MAPTSETYDQWLAKQKSPKFESKVKERNTRISKKDSKKHQQLISREGTKRKKDKKGGVA